MSNVVRCENCKDPLDEVFEEAEEVSEERAGIILCNECGVHARMRGELPDKPEQEGLDAF